MSDKFNGGEKCVLKEYILRERERREILAGFGWENLNGRDSSEDLRHRWDNIKMGLKEMWVRIGLI